jgi:hypothetical protein
MATRHFLCCDAYEPEPAPIWEGCDPVCKHCEEPAPDGRTSHLCNGDCGFAEYRAVVALRMREA